MPHREILARVEQFFGPARLLGVESVKVLEEEVPLFVFEIGTPEGSTRVVRAHRTDGNIRLLRDPTPRRDAS